MLTYRTGLSTDMQCNIRHESGQRNFFCSLPNYEYSKQLPPLDDM